MGKLLKKPKLIIFLLAIAAFSAVVFYVLQSNQPTETAQAQAAYLDGQIIVDPDNPAWLKYQNGGSFYMCGPGDPEDFLYRGARNADGTRNGDQMILIDKLKNTGANSIYMQAIRSGYLVGRLPGGGDNLDNTHNPFNDYMDPSSGINTAILDQWETWFDEMENNNIVIYFFFYDDDVGVWNITDIDKDIVGSEERSFIQTIVNKFEHHKNIIWVIAEEYEEEFTVPRVKNIAAEIRAADNYDHIIAVHKNDNLSFLEFADDPNIDQFAIQRNGQDYNVMHNEMVTAFNDAKDANDRYNINLAEAAGHKDADTRKKNWALATGGANVMVFGWDIESTPIGDLEDCGRLVSFMEARNLTNMAPHDELIVSGQAYVLADMGNEYIAYLPNGGSVNLRLESGTYFAWWYNPRTGGSKFTIGFRGGGVQTFDAPDNNDWALEIVKENRMIFPGTDWIVAEPEDLGVDSILLDNAMNYLAAESGAHGTDQALVVRKGYLIKQGNDIDNRHNVWSVTKSFTSTVLGKLIDQGKTSLDVLAKNYDSSLSSLYPNLTLRHFTTHTSGYRAQGDELSCHPSHGQSLTPFTPTQPGFALGSMYEYADSPMNEFGKVLTAIAGETIEDLFKREIADPIGMTNWDWYNWPDTVNGDIINGGAGNKTKGIQITARELARFCHLYLNEGNWNGNQVISSSWVNQATSVQVPNTFSSCSDQEGPGVYGYNWWVNGIGPDGKRLWPDATVGTYQALGHNNNRCIIIPEYEMVIVRTGTDGVVIDDNQINTFLGMVNDSILTTNSCLGLSCGESCGSNKVCNGNDGDCVDIQQSDGALCGCDSVCNSGYCNACFEASCDWQCYTPGPTCAPSDLVCDSTINTADLLEFKSLWGQTGKADLNQDDITNTSDLAIIMSTWGNY